ncbi:nucleotidyltransferase domain-containing protein [Homoserinibacter sp. YIM 151385]|uniref:nucleotidyltransferase domain-containing protein n=1 Tax=Homoserinibacter sp. YIM 151385 TaxID=2985506 RepID=UPI0022F0EE73|nr:nucleotidyltransferase domain-containing protein [Homoserinibacter sp. YIM 151385]WBU37343.1 nucleotidyltransferase domain-containing protein [Homoserinibacter sp. YIM 151385]
MDDAAFLAELAGELAGLDGVVAVSLGGSRAQGAHRPDSDWDLGLHYRAGFDPASLRALGHPGEVSELGGWGGGVFDGGAWLRIGERAVDVHYRDVAVLERELTRAEAGEFAIEPLMFHLAGIPSYLLVAELALGRVLHGALPAAPEYPAALRHAAFARWWGDAQLTLAYARTAHAPAGRATQTLAMLGVAVTQTAHAVLAARGEWIANERTLLDRAGLRGVDVVLTRVEDDAAGLKAACVAVETLATDAAIAARRLLV